MSIQLSFVISTRNRLPFLQITLERLIVQKQANEEIVVVDGNSTDGTKSYLQHLFDQGKIQQYLSEPDKNQAHGWNKAMLMARGTIIKKIIDDDVFCYKAIRTCKDYMLTEPKVDIVISNDLCGLLDRPENVQQLSRYKQFEQWKNGVAKCFTFGDVHMLIRRSALAYIGLYDTAFTMMDYEYALRISSLQTDIAYYTGYNALTVAHPATVTSLKELDHIAQEGKKVDKYYGYPGDSAEISLWSKVKIAVGKQVYRVRPKQHEQNKVLDIKDPYTFFYEYINSLNTSQPYEFIRK